MTIQLQGVINNVTIGRTGKLPKLEMELFTQSNEKVNATLILGIGAIKKIVRKIGKTVEQFREGLTNKKIEFVIE